MNVYTGVHAYYCGIDLHERKMYVCILDDAGKTVFHKNIPCKPDRFLQAIAPFRGDLVVGVECIFCWYWLADLCEEESIDFVLGHALYMKASHGVKTKNDRIDSMKIARLIRGGNFPLAYVYPPKMRATRDLMRRRTHFVRSGQNFLVIFKIRPPNTIWTRWEVSPGRIGDGERYRRPLSRPCGSADCGDQPEDDQSLRSNY